MQFKPTFYLGLIIILSLKLGKGICQDLNSDGATVPAPSGYMMRFTKSLENITRDCGTKSVQLICEVQLFYVNRDNAKFTIEWTKNYAPVEKDKRRITIKTTTLEEDTKYRSVVKIKKLYTSDSGFYECSAHMGAHAHIRSEAVLKVNGNCDSYQVNRNTLFDTDDGLFDLTTPPHPVKQPVFALDNDISTIFTTNYSVTQQLCQIYNGTHCQHYLNHRLVFVQPPFTQAQIEERLKNAFLVVSQSNDISPMCTKFAQPSLCFSAFPLCHNERQVNDIFQARKLDVFQPSDGIRWGISKEPRPQIRNLFPSTVLRRICRNDCRLLETELCSKEYTIAKRHLIIGKILELEECIHLPPENDTYDTWRTCLRLGVDRDSSVNIDDTCYWERGEQYRGVRNTTVTGKQCVKWSDQFSLPLFKHSELRGHNFCRNPANMETQPFCYVSRDARELCAITNCAHIIGFYVLASFIAVSTIVCLVVGVYCCACRVRHQRKLHTTNHLQMPMGGVDKNIYGSPGRGGGGGGGGGINHPALEMNALLAAPSTNHNKKHQLNNTIVHYTYKEVRLLEELGEGAFGKVYKGELGAVTGGGGKIFVAVKTLKQNANAKTLADFQREIELCAELRHPNIICLVGVVVKQEPRCMLFEYMSEGDLHEFLMSNAPHNGKSLLPNQFLHIAIQIAHGMEYLSENHYVHRDLAARNCLVTVTATTKDILVKISDFGLSRDMYSCDYYRVQSKSLLPVRWMPPESILYGKFTTESDVWSYGVVLWEIYSYGLQPYYGCNNQEVISMIRARQLLPCPEACPTYCYALMVECWAEIAVRRPNFGEIAHRLKVWKQQQQMPLPALPPPQIAYYHRPPPPLAATAPPPPLPQGGGTSMSRRAQPCSSAPSVSDDNTINSRAHLIVHSSQSSLTSKSSSTQNTANQRTIN